jgi:hypothetical protein
VNVNEHYRYDSFTGAAVLIVMTLEEVIRVSCVVCMVVGKKQGIAKVVCWSTSERREDQSRFVRVEVFRKKSKSKRAVFQFVSPFHPSCRLSRFEL